jgi:hypothetical protein
MLWRSHRITEAAAWIETTLRTFGTILPPGHAKRIRAYETASEIHLEAKEMSKAWEEALVAEQEGLKNLLLNIQGMAEPSALVYKQGASRGLPVLLRLLAQTHTSNTEVTKAAWEGLIASRNVVTDELVNRRHVTQTPETQEFWDEIRRIRHQLGHLYVQGPPPSKESIYTQALDELERHLATLEERFALIFPRKTRPAETLESVHSVLRERSALVSVATFEESSGDAPPKVYGAFILREGVPFLVEN